MNIIVWLVILAAAYCSVGFWVANIMRAFRAGRMPRAATLHVLPVVTFILDMFLAV